MISFEIFLIYDYFYSSVILSLKTFNEIHIYQCHFSIIFMKNKTEVKLLYYVRGWTKEFET